MDSFDGSNSDQNNVSPGPGAKETAEHALLMCNEDIEASPVVPEGATTQHVHNRPNPDFFSSGPHGCT